MIIGVGTEAKLSEFKNKNVNCLNLQRLGDIFRENFESLTGALHARKYLLGAQGFLLNRHRHFSFENEY